MSKLNQQSSTSSSSNTNQLQISDNNRYDISLNNSSVINNLNYNNNCTLNSRIRSNSCINQLNLNNNNCQNHNSFSEFSFSNHKNSNGFINNDNKETIANTKKMIENLSLNKPISFSVDQSSLESSRISENSESQILISNTTFDSNSSSQQSTSLNSNSSSTLQQNNKYLTTPLLSISSSSTLSSSSSTSSASSFATTSPNSIKLSNVKVDTKSKNSQINNEEKEESSSAQLNVNELNKNKPISTLSTNNNAINNNSTMSSSILNNNASNNSPESQAKSIFTTNNTSSFRESSSSYKKQKENYLTEKKRITNDMLQIMRDERIIVLADWLKVRGSLKNWIKLYAILKPGIMLLFKSDKMKPGQWVGTIILNSCQLLERPSKKHGFCFKIFHPLEKSIWASKGPSGENYINVPYMLLPTFYLIFRAPSEKIGNIWMEAIELTLKSSNLTKPSLSSNINSQISLTNFYNNSHNNSNNKLLQLPTIITNSSLISNNKQSIISNSDEIITSNNAIIHKENRSNSCSSEENLVVDSNNKQKIEMIDNKKTDELNYTDSDNYKSNSSDELCSLNSSIHNDDLDESNSNLIINENNNRNSKFTKKSNISKKVTNLDLNENKYLPSDYKFNRNCSNDSSNSYNNDNILNNEQDSLLQKETIYILSPKEEFGELGNKGQTEEVREEDKSLIFCLVKQVRPGMDLSKVVLPTFILEPRSFLEKLTDYYYHSDILSESMNNDDPYERMKSIVKFYLSGFYKKPKGLKKPYNPILGEVFRSYWYNPKTDSKTFYIAEQVSHHPPITAFYVTNRKEGFCIYGTILARSKFYGNSVSAIMEGNVRLVLLKRGEEYVITLPYANCKGILIGKLTMELGGKVQIDCAKTGYSAEIDFKLKPLLGGVEASNLIEGKIKFAKETMAVINGKWDGEIFLHEKKLSDPNVLWNPTEQIIKSRLKRFVVPIDTQMDFESEKLWQHVSSAIKNQDQNLATEEKTKIELKQREAEQERRAKFIEYKSKFFTYDTLSKEWIYNYSDTRPWDQQTDLFQMESEFKIFTKTKHNLKVKSIIADPRTSLITLHRSNNHQRPRNIIENEPPMIESIGTSNDTSENLMVQYNEIKDRLDKIEKNLINLNIQFRNNDNNNKILDFGFKQNKSSIQTSNDESIRFILITALIAWFIGLVSATLIFQKTFIS